MTQVIIYTNDNGNVSICSPTGELPIEEVLAKDCPAGAVIVDASVLPQGEDDFFNAWRMGPSYGQITVDVEAAKTIHLARINGAAKLEAQHRATVALQAYPVAKPIVKQKTLFDEGVECIRRRAAASEEAWV